jgi:hypothetical protein
MTEEDQTALLKAISTYIREEILKAFTPLRERIEAVEATGVRYQGIYQKAQEYRRGDCVTHDGSMWIATCETPPHQIPGNSSRWQLSVKAVERRMPTRPGTDRGR